MQTTKPLFENVVLTEEETQEALRLAREYKHIQLHKEAYWKKITEPQNVVIPDARMLYNWLRSTKSQKGETFVINEWNKEVIFSLCLYFAGDPRFKDRGEGFSLDKGIFINGPVGVGKTHLMTFFSCNPFISYITPTCKSIVNRFIQDWIRDDQNVIEYYSKNVIADVDQIYGHRELGVCFGDLGTENDANAYGNKKNVIEEIIFNRYEAHLPFNRTHFTTNLDPSQIKERYGERVADRLREMCNVLTLGVDQDGNPQKGFR